MIQALIFDCDGTLADTMPLHWRAWRQVTARHGAQFAAVEPSEYVVHQQPAPDIFLEAARRLGIAPQFCRAYEDTDLGMTAIRAAGMEAIDVRDLLGISR